MTAFSDGCKDESEMVPAPKKLIVNERKKKRCKYKETDKQRVHRSSVDLIECLLYVLLWWLNHSFTMSLKMLQCSRYCYCYSYVSNQGTGKHVKVHTAKKQETRIQQIRWPWSQYGSPRCQVGTFPFSLLISAIGPGGCARGRDWGSVWW